MISWRNKKISLPFFCWKKKNALCGLTVLGLDFYAEHLVNFQENYGFCLTPEIGSIQYLEKESIQFDQIFAYSCTLSCEVLCCNCYTAVFINISQLTCLVDIQKNISIQYHVKTSVECDQILHAIINLNIGTDRPEQWHLIGVYIICYSSSTILDT